MSEARGSLLATAATADGDPWSGRGLLAGLKSIKGGRRPVGSFERRDLIRFFLKVTLAAMVENSSEETD